MNFNNNGINFYGLAIVFWQILLSCSDIYKSAIFIL